MDKKNWIKWIRSNFNKFVSYFAKKYDYEIIEIYKCPRAGLMKAKIQLNYCQEMEKNVVDIVGNLTLLEKFSKKTIYILTQIAATEHLQPDYFISEQHFCYEIDDYMLEICSKTGNKISRKTPLEMSKDKSLLAKFSPSDANRIGYLAGVKETSDEYKMKAAKIVVLRDPLYAYH